MNAKTQKNRFAICIKAEPDDDLEVCKIYQVLEDAKAAEVGCLRIIDDSGEDYLYSASRFILLELPTETSRQLLKAVQRQGV